MHIGINNDNVEYLMNGEELSVTNTEKDLGVMISDDFKSSNQCSKVVKTANKLVILEFIYNPLVCSLKYCVQFSSPYYWKDIDRLERV